MSLDISGNQTATDFRADPEIVRTVAEGERLSYGHQANPHFAAEISLIDPLPHQRLAVYKHMLPQQPLRFLLADDAGAGKTIMTGLYLREMLVRRTIRRILIVPPAGLVGNWQRELRQLFSLSFRILKGSQARSSNPFIGSNSNQLIVSVDTLLGENVFGRLQDSEIEPYDLVVFDEAHKLSANRDPNYYIRKTNRYRLAEALAGINVNDERWQLGWSCTNLLLLTATPHMGKDYPYYALWRLLEPETLSTFEAFSAYPHKERRKRFLRRTKEEMVFADGKPLYPPRSSDTLSYQLTQGMISEQTLYDETTSYIKTVYNRARILNRSAARLAMSVFQRRLSSSTYALLRSMQRRLEKLTQMIADVEAGLIELSSWEEQQVQLEKMEDVFEVKTADEEESDAEEENEAFEEQILGGIVAQTLAQLENERLEVKDLVHLAQEVYNLADESKFEKLREVVNESKYRDEKILIFTEHRDTLNFLINRFEALGYTGQIAQIHGGMPYTDRDDQIEFFRKPADDGGATYMIATDAAGEGLNMQFCRVMINYDIPWNPARLEQRMGRIHRYGQKYPVTIINLIADKTREGRVVKTLLEKLERIRKELGSDKVFDVIGRVLQGISMKAYIEQTLDRETEEIVADIEATVNKEKIEELQQKEQAVYGAQDDVTSHLDEINRETEREPYFHLLPGYVRRYLERALPALHLNIDGDWDGVFGLKVDKSGALDPFLTTIESYSLECRNHYTLYKPERTRRDLILLHPGEPIFEALRDRIAELFGTQALRGAVFVDPEAKQPYTYHLFLVTVTRQADSAYPSLKHQELLEQRLIALKQTEDGMVEEDSLERLLLLRGDRFDNKWLRFLVNAPHIIDRAQDHAQHQVGARMADHRRAGLLDTLDEHIKSVDQGYHYQEAELALARSKLSKKAREGNAAVRRELARVKQQQLNLGVRQSQAKATLNREPELIAVTEVHLIANALVIPSSDPRDKERQTKEIEAIAVQAALDYEKIAHDSTVIDVSTPASARAAGLKDNPGFDLLSRRPEVNELRIEVKGRARIGDIEISENEWAAACTHGDSYWLYVVFNCATNQPRLWRVQNPFKKIIGQNIGIRIDEQAIFEFSEIT